MSGRHGKVCGAPTPLPLLPLLGKHVEAADMQGLPILRSP